jgi:hypothetical protein
LAHKKNHRKVRTRRALRLNSARNAVKKSSRNFAAAGAPAATFLSAPTLLSRLPHRARSECGPAAVNTPGLMRTAQFSLPHLPLDDSRIAGIVRTARGADD